MATENVVTKGDKTSLIEMAFKNNLRGLQTLAGKFKSDESAMIELINTQDPYTHIALLLIAVKQKDLAILNWILGDEFKDILDLTISDKYEQNVFQHIPGKKDGDTVGNKAIDDADDLVTKTCDRWFGNAEKTNMLIEQQAKEGTHYSSHSLNSSYAFFNKMKGKPAEVEEKGIASVLSQSTHR